MHFNYDDIPIIIVHRFGWPEYLMLTAIQARSTNLNNRIIIVGDRPFADMKGLVDIVDYESFSECVQPIRESYFHLSPNAVEYERVCIERWFVVRELVKQIGAQRCFAMDCDVLLFNSLKNFWPRYEGYDFAYNYGPCFNTLVVNNLKMLDVYCETMVKVFNRDLAVWPGYADHIHFSEPYRKPEFISDMTLGDYFIQTHKEFRSAMLTDIVNGSAFECCMTSCCPGYEMEGAFKKIVMRDGVPYGRFAATGEMVKFDCLHFQGLSKSLMPQFFDNFQENWRESLAGTAARS